MSKSTEHAGNSEFCCNPVVFSIIIPLPSLRPIRVVCSERRKKTRELARIEFYTLAKLRRIGKAKEVWRRRSLGSVVLLRNNKVQHKLRVGKGVLRSSQ